MARLPRLVLPGHPHLIVHGAQTGAFVVGDDADRKVYLDALANAARETRVAVHGYGLNAVEVRLLVTPMETGALARLMQTIGRRYVRHYNAKYQCTGTPWEGRFRSTLLEADAWFLRALRHVEALHADELLGCSSLVHHLGEWVDPLITEHTVFWSLGNTPFERQSAYRRWFEAGPTVDEAQRIAAAARHGWPLGSEAFLNSAASATGRRARPKAPGRPSKQVSPP